MALHHDPKFRVALARDPQDVRSAQALRYDVFVREMGGSGALVDDVHGLETDAFDPHCEHLLLMDDATGQTVGAYRMMTSDRADDAGQFYSEGEYDLTRLRESGRTLLELGRSCLHVDYRGGPAMFHLWNGLAEYIAAHDIEILFGVASFHGTDPLAFASSLSLLHHRHLAPEALRVTAKPPGAVSMDIIPEDQINRPVAMRAVPALIKAYLRLGGTVGQGAFIDHDFNTTDVCLIMDTSAMSGRQTRIYGAAS